MIRNYLKLGLRTLAKNRLSSAINILGLGLAVGCSLVVFQFFDWSMHLDNFHRKLNNLFVIERLTDKNGQQQLWGNSPSPMGPMLKADIPQVKNITRVNNTGVIIKRGDNVFKDDVDFVDDAFYQMFDFPVKWGNKQHFTDQDGIVLTDELSQKLFGKENPVGKNLNVRFSNNGRETAVNFTIKGVFTKRPTEASWYFSALVPRSKMASLGMDKPGDWSQGSDMTFIEVNDQTSLTPSAGQVKKYLQLYNAANIDDKIAAFNFQPLKTMNFHSYKVYANRFTATHIAGYLMLLVIAIATLLLVYFNYMNIAIASASTRLKEIGVRKVMGSSRKQIIIQFILENLILCALAVVVGLFLAKYIFLPWFSQISNIDLTTNFYNNPRTWQVLAALVVISALSGASYPAFYISAFKPINIMKGNSKMGSNNRFRKSLLGFQFFLTFLAISVAIAFVQETKQVKTRPWGYNPADNVVVALDKTASYEAFKSELKRNNKVISVTGSEQALGQYTKQLVIKTEGRNETVQSISALPGFAMQMGISITKGRDMSEQYPTDQKDAVLVNQAFLKQMGWTTAIGKNIEYGNHRYQVVGEINDFHFQNFQAPVGALVIVGCTAADVNNVYVKMSSGYFTKAHMEVEQLWKRTNPNLPFEYHYQDTVFDSYFSSFSQVAQVMSAASMIMVVISVSGIFGLALLILGKKMKEISVRKVLGAGMSNIIFLINKEFLYALGVALLFGVPFSWWLTDNLFKILAPESTASMLPLILSFVSVLMMTAISVSWHIFKAHTSNPTRYLKDE
ncbi:MAG TPA: ABC transporter permease [Mucilaginibacter sp.]|nr:ABC transporter permease [Mucilaginibacter sp.]